MDLAIKYNLKSRVIKVNYNLGKKKEYYAECLCWPECCAKEALLPGVPDPGRKGRPLVSMCFSQSSLHL